MREKVRNPKFKKQLIWFDKEAFEKHNAEGRQKLVLLAQAVEFMSRHIKRVNAKKAVEVGFEMYFLDQLVQQNKKFKEMGINNPVKVLDLLDISVFELIRIEEEFETLKQYHLEWEDGTAIVKSDKEQFCKYTKTEEENIELEIANNLIKSITEVKGIKTGLQPMMIIRAFNGFINYNWSTHEFSWNFNRI